MKRQLGIFLLLLITVHAAHKNVLTDSSFEELMKNPDWISLVEKSSRARALKPNNVTDKDEDCPSLYSCKDCTTSRVCKPNAGGGLELVGFTDCKGLTPYCSDVSGTCVGEVTDTCGEKDKDFICMGVRKYPDNNCKHFHVCDKSYEAYKFECMVEGESYNAVTGSCDSNAVCGEFDCQGVQGTKVAHSQYPGYFAYCQKDDKPLVIDSCNGDYELNVTSQQCEPACKREGLVQNNDDCTSYYQCTNLYVAQGMSFMRKEKKYCPQGQGYSSKDYICIDLKNLPNCKPK